MMRRVLFEGTFAEVLLSAVHGDITLEDVDAVVNAANNYLKHGGGVAGAIVRRGGKIIQEESDRIGYVPTGEAVFTSGGNLKARYVIHTVGPVWGEGNEEEKLRKAVSSALRVARDLGIFSVALPAISTGVFGYPKELAVGVIVDQVLEDLERFPESLKEIRFVDIDSLTAELFGKELSERLR